MSGLELVAVVACIGAIVSAYHDGAALVAQIKAKRRARREALQNGYLQELTTQELESSLHRGEGIVQSQFERDARRFGEKFRVGDQIACNALKDIIIHLQGQMIANLKIQWHQETICDFSALQDVSDSSQDRVVMVLLQLQQRIIMAGPVDRMNPPSGFWDPNAVSGIKESQTAFSITHSPTVQAPTPPNGYSQGPVVSRHPQGSTHSPPIPSYGMLPQPPSPPASSNSIFLAHNRSQSDEKPKATTRKGFFGKMRKEPVAPSEPIPKLSDAVLVPQYMLPTIQGGQMSGNGNTRQASSNRASLTPSITSEYTDERRLTIGSNSTSPRDGSSFADVDSSEFNPWAVPEPTHTSQISQDTKSIASSNLSHNSQDTRSTKSFKQPVQPSTVTVIASHKGSISAKDLLPSEANKYSGFCKGAWRLQIGDKKKAMEERQRPGTMYTAIKFWKCSRCNFEGRLVQLDKKTAGFDRQVMLADGIQFRWAFLFKSHVECKSGAPNPLKSTFGCIFCCAEGRGTPTFEGAQSLMDHLQEHRIRLPVGEVLYRMNCQTGPTASTDEDFDIHLVPKEGITI
ncbi:MAG: hypothetical protein Q9220_000979 [cf. Caloplaca sp. 1 TL-2023]